MISVKLESKRFLFKLKMFDIVLQANKCSTALLGTDDIKTYLVSLFLFDIQNRNK